MKVCFLAANNSTWVKQDQEILSHNHEVSTYYISGLGDLIHSLIGILSSDFVFCWFASFRFFPHIILAKILGRSVIIAIGGYEVARLDSINYGAMKNGGGLSFISRFLRKFMIRRANLLLAVSQASYDQIIREIGHSDSAQIKKISLAVKAPQVQIPVFLNRKKQVVVLATVENQIAFDVKGIDVLIELAQIMPDYEFYLLGKYNRQIFPKLMPSNLILAGWVENMSETFIEFGLQSRFVLQPSRHESFGMSLVEMACFGAYPLGSSAFALKETISTLGGKNVESNRAIDYKVEIERIEVAKAPDLDLLSRRAKENFSVELREKNIGDVLSFLDKN